MAPEYENMYNDDSIYITNDNTNDTLQYNQGLKALIDLSITVIRDNIIAVHPPPDPCN